VESTGGRIVAEALWGEMEAWREAELPLLEEEESPVTAGSGAFGRVVGRGDAVEDAGDVVRDSGEFDMCP
jgi:hypothetical protein